MRQREVGLPAKQHESFMPYESACTQHRVGSAREHLVASMGLIPKARDVSSSVATA